MMKILSINELNACKPVYLTELKEEVKEKRKLD